MRIGVDLEQEVLTGRVKDIGFHDTDAVSRYGRNLIRQSHPR